MSRWRNLTDDRVYRGVGWADKEWEESICQFAKSGDPQDNKNSLFFRPLFLHQGTTFDSGSGCPSWLPPS